MPREGNEHKYFKLEDYASVKEKKKQFHVFLSTHSQGLNY